VRIPAEEKRWVACLDCLKGSVYDKETVPTTTECQVCHDIRPCVPGERIALLIPYIPLQFMDIFETEPIDNKNQCAACKDKRVMLSLCGTCHKKKCYHLMKPSSPNCLACVAGSS